MFAVRRDGIADLPEVETMSKKPKKSAVASAVGGVAVMVGSYLLLAAINAFLDKTSR